ncbi:MAG: KH domain-containing protein [Desulfosudis oleivorans]|nr:KH domain-containing protein [Desulfosudis oleivorans]
MEKDLVEYIAKSLVDDPIGVVVNMIEGEKSTILELKVAESDIGKVIGKHGRIAQGDPHACSSAVCHARPASGWSLEILD